MQWNSEANAGFTTGKPWEPLDANYKEVNVAAQTNDSNSLLTHYRELIDVRNTNSALRAGTYYEVKSDNSAVYAALTMDENETILTLINLSDQAITDYTLTLGRCSFNRWNLQDRNTIRWRTSRESRCSLGRFPKLQTRE